MSNPISGRNLSDPMPGRPQDFIVRLDGLKLDEAARNRIAGAIQTAVMSELGRLDLGHPETILIHTPKEWLGRWLREIHSAKDLENTYHDVTTTLKVA
jgi:hypothetical protein